MSDEIGRPDGLIAGVVRRFLDYRLSVLFMIFALAAGLSGIITTPREEDPQIIVPIADIYIRAPGASAEEVEKLVATPLERLLWQIDGVEYVYSVSRRDMAVVTVRFFVGEDRERSLVKLHNKITMNADEVPPVVLGWVVKPVEIDDVPIITLTLYSEEYGDYRIRRTAEEILARLAEVPDISRTSIVGGRRREVRVEPDMEKMAGLGMSFADVERCLAATDVSVTAGSYSRFNQERTVTSDSFVSSARDVEALIVGVYQGRPVYLRDVAKITDGPSEAIDYSRIGFSNSLRKQAEHAQKPIEAPAVTIALAKKKGTNAVTVAEKIIARVEGLKAEVVPSGINIEVTRNYGMTAQQKVNDLLSSLVFAIIIVVALLAFTLGGREALIVAFAVPISFALALFVNYLFGYTINRVTLFALILSLGLVVDDPITNVDNIQRHILMGIRGPVEATLYAVQEVLPPVILSTLAIIVSFIPMFFITGMMGPYMAPMAANVPLTVTFSTLCALTFVPWLSFTLLKGRLTKTSAGETLKGRDVVPDWVKNGYRNAVEPFLDSRFKRFALFIVIIVLLAFSAALAAYRYVPLKMLPFDNKNEFQIVLDMPEGTPMEATNRVFLAMEEYLRDVPEVTSFVSYIGTSSPMDFNGMVRHYYLRQAGNMGDIRVNLCDKTLRTQQSHEIVLRLRKDLEAIAHTGGAALKIVELPPGPPVLSTLVVEIYGAPAKGYSELARASGQVRALMEREPYVCDIDDTLESERERMDFVLDKEKAAIHCVSAQMIASALKTAVSGRRPATVHMPGERQALPVTVILPRTKRSSISSLAEITIKNTEGRMIRLGELGFFSSVPEESPIYHKNLERVVYVFGEMAGRAPAEAVLDMQKALREKPLPPDIRIEWAGEGEWKITVDVFRDLGIAYTVALLGIYILLVVQMKSFLLPLLIMVAIPLTIIGIMPGFWLFNMLFAVPVAGFPNPVFFTATSMIGMIALGGIVIRNSVVLIEFIDDSLLQGMTLKEAVLKSGAIRLRPILLTAGTTLLGSWPITLDPIFSGLAWALIFGLTSSTVFTLLVVPVVYYMIKQRGRLNSSTEKAWLIC